MEYTLICEISENPCGSDTWEINHPCQCSEYIRELETLNKLKEFDINSRKTIINAR